MKTAEALLIENILKVFPRQDISEIKGHRMHGVVLKAMEEYASQFKSQEEEDKWVSVADRLPELTEQVYWYNDENERVPWEGKFEVHVLAYDSELGIIKAHFDGRRFTEVSSQSIRSTVNVIAWQPLPSKPSKEDKQK